MVKCGTQYVLQSPPHHLIRTTCQVDDRIAAPHCLLNECSIAEVANYEIHWVTSETGCCTSRVDKRARLNGPFKI